MLFSAHRTSLLSTVFPGVSLLGLPSYLFYFVLFFFFFKQFFSGSARHLITSETSISWFPVINSPLDQWLKSFLADVNSGLSHSLYNCHPCIVGMHKTPKPLTLICFPGEIDLSICCFSSSHDILVLFSCRHVHPTPHTSSHTFTKDLNLHALFVPVTTWVCVLVLSSTVGPCRVTWDSIN